MDDLRRDDLAEARSTPPGDKLAQALEAMRLGFELKRTQLRCRFPTATEDEIERRFREWLVADDEPRA